jgi:UDP-N-acetylmuramoyl-tripeptide--D-alanyl-D-alanine ligase
MLELGIISSDAHLEIGRKVAEGKINYLFTVGMRARGIAKGAQMAGMHKDRIYSFDDNLELGKFLKDKIEEGDTVLIKGSRGMKMEEVVEEIKL